MIHNDIDALSSPKFKNVSFVNNPLIVSDTNTMDQAHKEKAAFVEALIVTIPTIPTISSLGASLLTIVTMTVVCRTNIGRIDLCALRKYLDENPKCLDEGMCVSSKTMGNNAVIFKLCLDLEKGKRNVSAKIFATGSMHITGVHDPVEAVILSDFFCANLYKASEHEHEHEHATSFKTETYEICMINSYFSIPFTVNLLAAKDACAKDDISCVLNLDRHPGLQCKVKAQDAANFTSIFIFSSGKIIVTGARSPGDLVNAYRRTCLMLSTHSADVLLPPAPVKVKGKRGRKKKVVAQEFYGVTL